MVQRLFRWVRHFKVGGNLVSSGSTCCWVCQRSGQMWEELHLSPEEPFLCWKLIFQPGLSSRCLRSAAVLDKRARAAHCIPTWVLSTIASRFILNPHGSKLSIWDVAEEPALVGQSMPSSVRDIRIVPWGVTVWKACSAMQKCLNWCPFSLSFGPGMFLLALASVGTQRHQWNILGGTAWRTSRWLLYFFPRKNALQQAVWEA